MKENLVSEKKCFLVSQSPRSERYLSFAYSTANERLIFLSFSSHFFSIKRNIVELPIFISERKILKPITFSKHFSYRMGTWSYAVPNTSIRENIFVPGYKQVLISKKIVSPILAFSEKQNYVFLAEISQRYCSVMVSYSSLRFNFLQRKEYLVPLKIKTVFTFKFFSERKFYVNNSEFHSQKQNYCPTTISSEVINFLKIYQKQTLNKLNFYFLNSSISEKQVFLQCVPSFSERKCFTSPYGFSERKNNFAFSFGSERRIKLQRFIFANIKTLSLVPGVLSFSEKINIVRLANNISEKKIFLETRKVFNSLTLTSREPEKTIYSREDKGRNISISADRELNIVTTNTTNKVVKNQENSSSIIFKAKENVLFSATDNSGAIIGNENIERKHLKTYVFKFKIERG